jgi:DNA-binding NarL/FixJ family response regulator
MHRDTSRARIVIADDHELARAGLRSVLESDPRLEVVGEGRTGLEAVALCRSLHPDLALLDVRMPEMDGLAATQAIKEDAPGTSVILFTMHEDPAYLLEALKTGASAYLLKGATRRQIRSAVHQVLAGESLLHAEVVLQMLTQFAEATQEGTVAVQLTPRERDVLRLVALGQTNREIGKTLGFTSSTAKTHVEHLIGKLGVSDRTQAAVRAIKLGLVSPTHP